MCGLLAQRQLKRRLAVELLTVPEIRKWLASLLKRGKGGARDGATLDTVATHTGIPTNTLKWLARMDTAKVGLERRRILTKLIAEYENGLIQFVKAGRPGRRGGTLYYKKMIRPEKPRVRQRYSVNLTLGKPHAQPTLRAIDRPGLPGKMPSFKDLLGKG